MQIPDKLKLLSKISSDGNFGEVLLYENTYLKRKEAIKIISIKGKTEKDIAVELNNNLFESSVLEYLRKSQYIVDIYDAEFISSGFRIRMEFLENGSVQNLLNKNIFLSTKQIIKISECVLHALEHAHAKEILHLDIKPGNILIKNENIYKLSDFGLSNIKNKDGSSIFKKIYTAHYPPEKLSGQKKEANEQSDIYMLGVTLYRLINGDSYFSEQFNNYKKKEVLKNLIISGKFPDRTKYLPHVHTKLKRIINRCLNIDLEKRYEHVREIRSDFGKIRRKYNWVVKNISEKFYHWECYDDQNLFLELIAERKLDLWEISLKKYTKKSKLNIKKYCFKNLNEEDFYKKLQNIFNDFF